jgi:hypothetical protein
VVRVHPTVPLFNDLADSSRFLALFLARLACLPPMMDRRDSLTLSKWSSRPLRIFVPECERQFGKDGYICALRRLRPARFVRRLKDEHDAS